MIPEDPPLADEKIEETDDFEVSRRKNEEAVPADLRGFWYWDVCVSVSSGARLTRDIVESLPSMERMLGSGCGRDRSAARVP